MAPCAKTRLCTAHRIRQVTVAIIVTVAICAFAFCIQILKNSTGNESLQSPPSQGLRLVTYNVHYISGGSQTGSWSLNDWERRKSPLDAAFKAISGDIIGFQEMETYGQRGADADQPENLALEWLLSNNPGYEAAATGEPDDFPSTQPIFYRSSKFSLLDEGWFFFSDTPDVIYSRTFNGSWSAFASWAELMDQTTGITFRVVNLHTDYSSGSNRIKSAELVVDRIEPWIKAGMNVFVLGDFNARTRSKTLGILESTGVSFASARGSTFHFNMGLNLFRAIDHIGHIGTLEQIGNTAVLRKKFEGEWPSDHYPVIVDFAL